MQTSTESLVGPQGTEPLIRQDDSDSDRAWLRTKRIFHTDNGWYVGTREDNLGPFPDRKLAVIELKRYVRELKRQKQDTALRVHSE